MDKNISTIKAEAKSLKDANETAAIALRRIGREAEQWLAVDVKPARTQTELSDKTGVSTAQLSKGRKLAATFTSDKALRDACKAAGVTVTIGNAYDLCPKSGRGSSEWTPQKAAKAFVASHKDMTRAEFDAFVREVRKSIK